jgi:hypothetical protein
LDPTSLPGLYQSSDKLSTDYQTVFFRSVLAELGFLVVGTSISLVNSDGASWAIAQALALLGALGFAIYLFAARPDRHWYAARAVAESIKTATWRFVSRGEPFDHSDAEDRSNFRNVLQMIVEQNKDVAQRLSTHLDGIQITADMVARRNRPLTERISVYLEERVKDQQQWYAQKAARNRSMAARLYGALIVTIAIAIAFAVSKVSVPDAKHWPTDLLIVIASGLFAWIQSKRYSELASSYSLAAHEISLIREQAFTSNSDSEFSRFVGDTENAFSREHTQWVARKDE